MQPDIKARGIRKGVQRAEGRLKRQRIMKGLPYEVCATQSLMCQRLALKEVERIKSLVDGDKRLKHLHPFRQGVQFTINGLMQRQTLLFSLQTRYEDSAKKDIRKINRLLDDITDALQPDVETLKRCLFKTLSYNDCVYENLLSVFLTVGTLLHHAVGIFGELDNPWKYIKDGYDIHTTINRIKPERELKNFENAVSATNLLPDGIDYMEDMDVHNAVVILARRMDVEFVQKFANKQININDGK